MTNKLLDVNCEMNHFYLVANKVILKEIVIPTIVNVSVDWIDLTT